MAEGKVSFSDINIQQGNISASFSIEGTDDKINSGEVNFNLVPKIKPRNDLVALALSTLCGRRYKEIVFDMEVSSSVISEIEKFTFSNVSVRKRIDYNHIRRRGNNITLNFSGGFDSLAALCLMPENTNLVSMDFGGHFSREKPFFEKFNPCVVSTNIIETNFRKNNWSFMGIASILFSDYLSTDYHTFGGILGASVLSNSSAAARNDNLPLFSAAGIENAPYVMTLTEVGTLSVILHYRPELVKESLISLANAGEEKRYRKQVLALIASDKHNIDLNLDLVEKPTKPFYKFGQNFQADFLIFYIIKNAGLEVASHTTSEIPEKVITLSKKLSLTFYERFNPNFIVNFPRKLRGRLMSKLSDANIVPYTEKDWQEYNEVRDLLSEYYNIKN